MTTRTASASLRRPAVVLLAAVLLVAGCSGTPAQQKPADTSASVDATAAFSASRPAPWDLTTPEKAVRSYLEWVSYSYRMANSDLSTPTMEPTETVRVDSYIQLNKEKGQGIEQKLVSFKVTGADVRGSLATLKAREDWTYRYFDLNDPTKYLSPQYAAQYDTTFSLVKGKDGLWRVDKVDAKPLGEVK